MLFVCFEENTRTDAFMGVVDEWEVRDAGHKGQVGVLPEAFGVAEVVNNRYDDIVDQEEVESDNKK